MRERTWDNLREIVLESTDGGRAYVVSVVKYGTAELCTPPVSSHVFGVYPCGDSDVLSACEAVATVTRIWRELVNRGECDGLTNWETASMALEIKHDGANYRDRLMWFENVTQNGLHIAADDMHGFAEIHGYLAGKAEAVLELVDWSDIGTWFEAERREWMRDQRTA